MKRSDLQHGDIFKVNKSAEYWYFCFYSNANDEDCFFSFGSERLCFPTEFELANATLIYSQDELSLEAMLDKLGDVNLRLDPDGYRCWIVGHTAVAEHFGAGMTRYESVKMCYEKWQAQNVELFGEMK